MPDTVSTPTDTDLQIEAAAVERLRRQISECTQQGQAASPQLLAEFAAVQKNYLSRKIEFEKAKRNSANAVAQTPRAGAGDLETPSDRNLGVSEREPGIAEPETGMAREVAKPRLSRGMFFLICATVGLALGLVLWLLLN